jgi:hypothetical protein
MHRSCPQRRPPFHRICRRHHLKNSPIITPSSSEYFTARSHCCFSRSVDPFFSRSKHSANDPLCWYGPISLQLPAATSWTIQSMLVDDDVHVSTTALSLVKLNEAPSVEGVIPSVSITNILLVAPMLTSFCSSFSFSSTYAVCSWSQTSFVGFLFSSLSRALTVCARLILL